MNKTMEKGKPTNIFVMDLSKEGAKQPNDASPMDRKDLDDAMDMVDRIGKTEANGYFIVVEVHKEKHTDEETQLESSAHGKVTNTTRLAILSTVFESLGIAEEQALKYLLMKGVSKIKENDKNS